MVGYVYEDPFGTEFVFYFKMGQAPGAFEQDGTTYTRVPYAPAVR